MCYVLSLSLSPLPLSISSILLLTPQLASFSLSLPFQTREIRRKISINMNSNTISSSSSPSSSSSSGWTLYLQHSTHDKFLSATSSYNKIHCYDDNEDEEREEEEDLSMVSDASSGPPHVEEDPPEDLFCYAGAGGRKRVTQIIKSNNVKLGRRRFEGDDFSLDDTASSHPMMNVIFSASKENGVENQGSSIKSLIDYSSQGFSATHFQVMVESRKRR